ncbi:hypothetical protein JGZ79_15270 [Pseudomonas aeruginosa]|jgi:hypothetical protein|uniref:hypothetical protein n=1 Tax=Pseudomonas aeruginosa TaxID=287 RepID=UPI0003AC9F50|nr:hypothetical protein [Pseudomonas aeruginosa]EQL40959.1 hypothetical protein M770_13395 [Pseudomonas aeruginosa VRFPA03]ALV77837.1 hypothetical protein AOY09_02782 [Pseudomonas aeruginosa]AYZ84625.1 hypothetical protein EGY27_17860 [Pseudomonas aeruginosa]EIU1659559.1 hypothetical protein [Pseudomonas aeruginosa]EJN6723952.1 hypothetical protein [Pseudomonas aeruginosa]
MAWTNERAEGVIEEAIVAMRRSVIPRHDQLVWRGQIEMAYTLDAIGTRQYDDMRRRLDAAADSRWAELRSTRV